MSALQFLELHPAETAGMDSGMALGLWRVGWACSFFYHGSSLLRVEVISARLSKEPHIPVPYWSGKENWAGILAAGNQGSWREISEALLIQPGQFVIDSFVCFAKPSPGWTCWDQFFSPHLLWVPDGYGHAGICRETWLNKFWATFVLGAVPCPSQLLAALSAAFAFCAAFPWWCQGWLHLLSLSFWDVPYAWNILLALSQESTFFLPPSVKLIFSTTPIRWADRGKK